MLTTSSNLLDVYHCVSPNFKFTQGSIERGLVQKQPDHYRVIFYESKHRMKRLYGCSYEEYLDQVLQLYIAEFIVI